MKNLYAVANICLNELHAIGIYPNNICEYTVNTRAKSRWGQCRLENGIYTINISSALLSDSAPEKSLKNTLIHELLHAVDGCMNHGAKWQMLAEKVNKAYGYNVKRCSSSSELGVELRSEADYHYIITCKKCNRTWKYMRNSKIVQCCRTGRGICPCGARNFSVISK